MKEATGEFSMTVVTILAVVVIAGLIGFLGPRVSNYVQAKWDVIENDCPTGMTKQSDGTCR